MVECSIVVPTARRKLKKPDQEFTPRFSILPVLLGASEDGKLTCLTCHTIPLNRAPTFTPLSGRTRNLHSAQTFQRLRSVQGARSRPHMEWWRRCVATTLALRAFKATSSSCFFVARAPVPGVKNNSSAWPATRQGHAVSSCRVFHLPRS
ncbi:hypothetical protein BJV78DRAFT_1227832 [Lactifluus subvellereus]|nr:hypothetical protein BJV78DRAFT_1227832 [Lactifluus subvellereus]